MQLAGRCADGVILGTGFDLKVFDWAKGKISEGTTQTGTKESDVAIIAAGMLCVRDDGHEARKIVRNRIAPTAPIMISASPTKQYRPTSWQA